MALLKHEPIRALISVCLFSITLALTIAWRISDRDGAPDFLSLLVWQLFVWAPWIFFVVAVRRIILWIRSATNSPFIRLLFHVMAGVIVAALHLLWFWWLSSRFSPLLAMPYTRHGAYAFFFMFWVLIDVIVYGALVLSTRNESSDQPGAEAFTSEFIVRKGRTTYFVKANDVEWIEAQGYYAELHTATENYLVRRSLTQLESELDPTTFFRIHRSTIVNIKCVSGLHSDDGNCDVVMKDGRRLRVSRSKRRPLKQRLGVHDKTSQGNAED